MKLISTEVENFSLLLEGYIGRFIGVELDRDELQAPLQSLAIKLSLLADVISPSDKSKAKTPCLSPCTDLCNNLKTEHNAILEQKNEIERHEKEVEQLVKEKHHEELKRRTRWRLREKK